MKDYILEIVEILHYLSLRLLGGVLVGVGLVVGGVVSFAGLVFMFENVNMLSWFQGLLL